MVGARLLATVAATCTAVMVAVAGATISGSVAAAPTAGTTPETSPAGVPAPGRAAPADEAGQAAATAPRGGEGAAEVSTVRVGPFVLPPAPFGEVPHVNRFLPNVPKPCEDCYITSIEPNLVHADGSRADMADGVMLHHLVIAEANRTDVTCDRAQGIGAMGRRLFASGDERTPITLPPGFGFKVDPAHWVGITELMNHSAVPQTVFFEAKVTHVPASTPGMKDVTPVWLDLNNCLHSEYAVPEGRSATAWTWPSSLTGRIVAAGGHVHAGGQGLTLDNASTGKRICSSRAGYGDGARTGMVTSMSTCSWDSLGTVRAGEKLKLTSLYDSPQALNDAMGIMLLAVYETGELDAGTTAPAHMRTTPTTKVPAQIHTGHGPGPGGHGGGHDGGGPPHH